LFTFARRIANLSLDNASKKIPRLSHCRPHTLSNCVGRNPAALPRCICRPKQVHLDQVFMTPRANSLGSQPEKRETFYAMLRLQNRTDTSWCLDDSHDDGIGRIIILLSAVRRPCMAYLRGQLIHETMSFLFVENFMITRTYNNYYYYIIRKQCIQSTRTYDSILFMSTG
jgi:hypothetical protein